MAISWSSIFWLREQSRGPFLGQSYVVSCLQTVLCPPPTSWTIIYDFVSLYINAWVLPNRTGSPALDCLSSITCHPCYPGEIHQQIPLTMLTNIGLPHMSRGSTLSSSIFEATYRFIFIAACNFAVRNSRPLISQTPLLRATEMNGQFLGQDFNLLDRQLLLRTDTKRGSFLQVSEIQYPLNSQLSHEF